MQRYSQEEFLIIYTFEDYLIWDNLNAFRLTVEFVRSRRCKKCFVFALMIARSWARFSPKLRSIYDKMFRSDFLCKTDSSASSY